MNPFVQFQQFAYSSTQVQTKSTNIKQPQSKQPQKIQKMKTKKNLSTQNIHNPQQTLIKIIQWRKMNKAPVDILGCQRLADPKAPIDIQKYQTLISLMLSIQTKDQITSMCVHRLQDYGLNPSSLSTISQQKLIQIIYECNFNKRKAKNIIEVSKLILKDGLARTTQGLMQYPGVGVKISMIYMNVAEGKQEGIGVDTHVHRISNKLGWVKTTDPNTTEKQLQKVFPVKYWKQMNIAMVGFGQIICNAKKPLCGECPVTYQCPSSLIKW